MSNQVEFKHLPLTVLPVNYAVTLKPNFNDFTFDGSITIDLEVSINLYLSMHMPFYFVFSFTSGERISRMHSIE